MQRLLTRVSFALALAAPLSGQILAATGRLEALPPGSCAPRATHTMECGAVLLQSQTIDLSSFGNQIITVEGDPVVVPGCLELIIDVTAAKPADARITMFSFQNFSIGSSFTLFTVAPLGAFVVHVFSVESAVVPLGPIGTLFLDPFSAQQWAFDIGIGLPFPRFLSIPNEPALIGCSPHFQAAVVDVANPLQSFLTNNACFVIVQ